MVRSNRSPQVVWGCLSPAQNYCFQGALSLPAHLHLGTPTVTWLVLLRAHLPQMRGTALITLLKLPVAL